jgi:hypothetical protein
MGTNGRAVEDMLTIDDAMSELGVSRTTVLGLGKEGRLLPVKIRGRLYYDTDQVTSERDRREKSNKILTRDPRDLGLGNRRSPVSVPTRPRAVPIYDGKTAARSVDLFAGGGGVREAVKELEITFEVGQHLHTEYRKAGSDLVLDAAAVRELGRWIRLGTSPTGAEIVKAIGQELVKSRQVGRDRSRTPVSNVPMVSYDIRSGRVDLMISLAGRDDEFRCVDVTKAANMTREELVHAGWIDPKGPAGSTASASKEPSAAIASPAAPDALPGRQPISTYDALSGRIELKILRASVSGDVQSRLVDVTKPFDMTSEELAYAGWAGPKRASTLRDGATNETPPAENGFWSRQPTPTYDVSRRRVEVAISREVPGGEQEIRFVDVTKLIAMTPDELLYAGWVDPKTP